jgi:hypothetical protein
MPQPKYTRFSIARGIEKGAKGVDRGLKHDKGKGAIFGYAVLTKGKLKDDIRQWEMDDLSLDQTVELGNQSKQGLKSRFGHPNMSSEALGTFLGRAKNFRKDGDIVRADLFFDESAYKTPNGDLAGYVLDLAESDPDSFGSSLVVAQDLEYRLEKDGTPKKDTKGNNLPALVRFKKLLSSDMVDDPAATEGVFGKFFNESVELSAKATEFLDKLLSNPDAVEKVMVFLERYRENRADVLDGQENIKNQTAKEAKMALEIKDLTADQLRSERSDLVSVFETEGTKKERARVLEITKAEHTEFAGKGMEAVSQDAIEKGLTVDASLAAMRAKRLKDIELEKNPAPGADAGADAAPKNHLDRAKEYQKEHKCTMTEALRATAEKKKAK